MLILSRRVSDEIVITLPDGQVIRIAVAELRNNCVRIAVETDRRNEVLRHELWEQRHGKVQRLIPSKKKKGTV